MVKVMFTKGDPRINRKGRPLGAVDKKWNNLLWWFSLVEENYESLDPKDKVWVGLKGMALLVSRSQMPQQTIEDSVKMAETTLRLMRELNANGIKEQTGV